MKPAIQNRWYRLSLRVLALVVVGAVVFPVAPAHSSTEAARVVKYAKEDIVPVRAKLRFSTLIVLPDDEEILDFTTGDKEFWIINGSHNLCYVHPAQAGIRSNLNLITATGHVYSFVLTEISDDPNAEPDLKIFVEPKEGSGVAARSGLRGYVSAGEAEAYKKELETLRAQTAEQVHTAQVQTGEEVNRFRSSYATKLQFDYLFDTKAVRDRARRKVDFIGTVDEIGVKAELVKELNRKYSRVDYNCIEAFVLPVSTLLISEKRLVAWENELSSLTFQSANDRATA